ncbi:hypothetical protein NIES2104_44280 [Leptolyngbya sp. NIES-2104]|nr:hypothetical protein NIES2104_44280 [Leptolyngbya sp. NIES-2104]
MGELLKRIMNLYNFIVNPPVSRRVKQWSGNLLLGIDKSDRFVDRLMT